MRKFIKFLLTIVFDFLEKTKKNSFEEDMSYFIKKDIEINKKINELETTKKLVKKSIRIQHDGKEIDIVKIMGITKDIEFILNENNTELENEIRFIALRDELKNSIKKKEENKSPYNIIANALIKTPLLNTLHNMLKSKEKLIEEESKEYNSIIEAIIISRISRDYKSYIYLILSFIIMLALSVNEQEYLIYATIPLLLVLCLYGSQNIIKYRINNNWYGNNYYEAREILNYLSQHNNDNDFFDGEKLKKLYPTKIDNTPENNTVIDGVKI